MEDEMMPVDPMAIEPDQSAMTREAPETSLQRKALVKSMASMVKEAKKHWEKQFRQMERDQRFCAGEQWPAETKASYFNDDMDDRYIANITLRHVQQRVAALYAKNPKAVARRRRRLLTTVWDGSMQTLLLAQQTLQQAAAAQAAQEQMMQMGGPPPFPGGPFTGGPQPGPGASMLGGQVMPAPPPPPMPDPVTVQQAQAVIEDAKTAKQQLDQLKRIAETLELLYTYEVDEQPVPFKSAMKMAIRRACTSGVGWVKIGFQRVMGKSPDYDTHLADLEQRLATIERISADLIDGETRPESAEAEQLRLAINDLMAEQEIVLREGLQFSYPKSTAIIVDPRCTQLRGFLGADWAAEEYVLSIAEIKETYGVDVGKSYQAYDRLDTGTDYERARAAWQRGQFVDETAISDGDSKSALVWEIYNKRDGMVYVVCDGYPEFLREPASPEDWIERFFPWFLVAFNETDGRVYPPSDVSLIRPMQLELNRSRQAMREHRFASRPKMAYAEGLLSQEDLEALRSHPVNALIAVSGLQPGQDVKSVLQPVNGVEFNPALYEVNPVFQDLMRAVGDQEANLGGTAEATATETSIAQQSRNTAIGSCIDDLDETLTEIAKAAGQILLLNVSEETVKEIVGPGAIWPTLTKADVAKNVWLEIEAASSGKPDQQLAIMNFEKLGPLLMQIPGITPTWMAREAIKRLDDRLDLDDALAEGAPSIIAQNSAKGGPGAMPGQGAAPSAQGPQGGMNAVQPPGPAPAGAGPKATQPMGPQGGPAA